MDVHPLSRVMLIDPKRVQSRLEELARARPDEALPNLWQVTLGAMRMWHRLLFRPESVGNCSEYPVRQTWRAKLLENRAIRVPALFYARAIAPWDLSGLFSSTTRVGRHLLSAHHEHNQFAYDLEMLSDNPPALDEIRQAAQAVVDGTHPRAQWLRDLVVYEGYHEDLVRALEGALEGDVGLSHDEAVDPDVSFFAFLNWCGSQPETPAETRAAWIDGRYTWADGLRTDPKARPGRVSAQWLRGLSKVELAAQMRQGHPVDPRSLDDSEWVGVSLGVPELVDKLAWKTFMKVFAREPGSGRLRGWNVRLEQDGLDAPPRAKTKGGAPFSFGHFEVVGTDDRRIPGGGAQGLLLDYGRGGNPRLDPLNTMRDPIVRPDPDNPDLLLGWSYLELGRRRVRTPSYFTLERYGPRTHTAAPPRTAMAS